ncbi:MAG: HAD family hydrolase [Gemmatimonadaceae bacterium]
MKRLVLFDIDGTLLTSDGAGRRAMTDALREVFGSAVPPSYRFDGKTDPQIVYDLMRLAGHDEADIASRMDALLSRYLVGLEAELATRAETGAGARLRLHEGVPELLDVLEARDDVVLGLLTGNLARGAELKLQAAGLDPARFRVGAFGSDHHHRPELPAIAQRRALDTLGLDLPAHALVVIGDTPADIACGRALGARALAVATGWYSVDELARHAPAAVFATLADTSAVVRAITDA